MNTKLYVGNLSFQTTEENLKQLFSEHGNVTGAQLITDKITGNSRGFAFVTMENEEIAAKAIQAMNGKNVDGRNLTVNEARPPRSGGQSAGRY
ncbi:MAG: RNA-binding protein [Verrucomicrobiae bacterium]|nr:RNA-binding protein [Verrucomicrobiae bacterium]